MKTLLAAIILLASRASATYPSYYNLFIQHYSSGTYDIAGNLCLSTSSSTFGTCNINVDGAAGNITSPLFTGSGAGLTNVPLTPDYTKASTGTCLSPTFPRTLNNGSLICAQPSDVTGNAATVSNGVYTSGSYTNPSWLTISNVSETTNGSMMGSGTSGSPLGVNSSSVPVYQSGSYPAASGASITNITAANISAGTAGINITGNSTGLSGSPSITVSNIISPQAQIGGSGVQLSSNSNSTPIGVILYQPAGNLSGLQIVAQSPNVNRVGLDLLPPLNYAGTTEALIKGLDSGGSQGHWLNLGFNSYLAGNYSLHEESSGSLSMPITMSIADHTTGQNRESIAVIGNNRPSEGQFGSVVMGEFAQTKAEAVTDTAPINILVLRTPDLSYAGRADSHAFDLVGVSSDSAGNHRSYWQQHVQETSNAGASNFVLGHQILTRQNGFAAVGASPDYGPSISTDVVISDSGIMTVSNGLSVATLFHMSSGTLTIDGNVAASINANGSITASSFVGPIGQAYVNLSTVTTAFNAMTLAYQGNISTQATADRSAWQANISTAIAAIPATEVSTNTITGVLPIAKGGTGNTTGNITGPQVTSGVAESVNGSMTGTGAAGSPLGVNPSSVPVYQSGAYPAASGAAITSLTPGNMSAGALAAGVTIPQAGVNLSTVTTALAGKDNTTDNISTSRIDLSTITTALSGKLSSTAAVPIGLIDLSTVTSALSVKASTGVNADITSMTGLATINHALSVGAAINSNLGDYAGQINFGGALAARLASSASSSELDINPDGFGSTVITPGGNAIRLGTSSGTNLYYCNAGASAGNVCRGNGCSCVGGSEVALGIYVK